MPVDLIVLAAVTVFILLRLYGVLGQNIGHDDSQNSRDATFDGNNKVIELTPGELERGRDEATSQPSPEPDMELSDELDAQAAALREEDPQFRMDQFIDGAKGAFEMVLDSYSKDDRETLRFLLSKSLYDEFAGELKQRKEQEQYTDTTLVSILEVEPVTIELDGKKATITVRFLSEQISVDRTSEGETVEGSASPIEQVEDTWSFTRDLRSSNPNWKIVAT
jgi:predicted lipid-binding transport protein (Tim44 family)